MNTMTTTERLATAKDGTRLRVATKTEVMRAIAAELQPLDQLGSWWLKTRDGLDAVLGAGYFDSCQDFGLAAHHVIRFTCLHGVDKPHRAAPATHGELTVVNVRDAHATEKFVTRLLWKSEPDKK